MGLRHIPNMQRHKQTSTTGERMKAVFHSCNSLLKSTIQDPTFTASNSYSETQSQVMIEIVLEMFYSLSQCTQQQEGSSCSTYNHCHLVVIQCFWEW
jgi:hypothetical protein